MNCCSAWDWGRCPKSCTANSNSPGVSARGHARSNTNRACDPNQMRLTRLHANRLARTAHMCRRTRSRLHSRACAERRWCRRPLRCRRLRPRHIKARHATKTSTQKKKALQDQTTYLALHVDGQATPATNDKPSYTHVAC